MPLITPSGLSIETILMTKRSLRMQASGALISMNSISPFIIQLPLASPGCTRAVRNSPFRSRHFNFRLAVGWPYVRVVFRRDRQVLALVPGKHPLEGVPCDGGILLVGAEV